MGGGGGQSSGDNSFSRNGGTSQTSAWNLGGGLSGLIGANVQQPGLDPNAKSQMVGRTTFDNSRVPYMTSLINTANSNPYSGNYENNTQEQFDNRTQKALALARTGQENVIAPLNRGQYFREAEVMNQSLRDRAEMLAGQRKVDADAQIGASNVLDRGEIGSAEALANLQHSQSQALYGAVDPLSTKTQSTNESYSGSGNQSGFAYGAGVNLCCFIFLESLNGTLPAYVRECRDEFATLENVRGYRLMSTWVVPAMRVSRLIRNVTNICMVYPCLFYGRWYKNQGSRWGWTAKPIVSMWFKVWTTLGKYAV